MILLFSFQGTKYIKDCAGDFADDKAREHRGAECTKVHEHRRMRAATKSGVKSTSRKSGDNSEEATPVPISNTVVKLLSADDTWWEAAWESRTLPVLRNRLSYLGLFFFALLYDVNGKPSVV